MDEKAAIEKAVRSRLSVIRFLNDQHKGILQFLDQMGFGVFPDLASPEYIVQAEKMRVFYLEKLKHATSFFLPESECNIVERNWENYPSLRIPASDVLVPNGFVYFEKPLVDPADGDPSTPVVAMSWSVHTIADSPLELKTRGEESFVITILGYVPTRTFLGEVFGGDIKGNDYPVMYSNVSVVWELDTDDGGWLWRHPMKDVMDHQQVRAPYIKVLETFFAIMRQAAEVGKPTEMTKKTRDRIKHARKALPGLNGDIQVIRFRSPKRDGNSAQSGTGTGRKMSVRSWTREHWREQPYRSTGEKKWILISPYVRGPEGAEERGVERIFLPAKPRNDQKSGGD